MDTVKHLFWNRDEARLRAGWRILLYNVFWLILLGVALNVSNTVLTGRLSEVYRIPLTGIIFTFLTLALVWGLAGGRLLDRRPIADYGFHLNKHWWLDLGFGLALGGLLMLGIFMIELALDWIEITGRFVTAEPGLPFGSMILLIFTTVSLIAAEEEISYRGYMLQNLAEGFNWKSIGPTRATLIAVLLSSAIFGILHASNPNATLFSTINTVLFAALVLGTGYVLTGELALSIGFHIMWNFVQVGVGYVGADKGLGAAFFALEKHGPELWTGGTYGHENGLLGTGAIILAFLLIAVWVQLRRGSLKLDPSIPLPPARSAGW